MENNNLIDIYSKKSTNDLIEQIRRHRSTGIKIEQEWLVVLKKHLFERGLSIEEKKELEYVLTGDSLELKKKY